MFSQILKIFSKNKIDLEKFPIEVLVWNIFFFLPIEDVMKFRLVSKKLTTKLDSSAHLGNNKFWKDMRERDFIIHTVHDLGAPFQYVDHKKIYKMQYKTKIKDIKERSERNMLLNADKIERKFKCNYNTALKILHLQKNIIPDSSMETWFLPFLIFDKTKNDDGSGTSYNYFRFKGNELNISNCKFLTLSKKNLCYGDNYISGIFSNKLVKNLFNKVNYDEIANFIMAHFNNGYKEYKIPDINNSPVCGQVFFKTFKDAGHHMIADKNASLYDWDTRPKMGFIVEFKSDAKFKQQQFFGGDMSGQSYYTTNCKKPFVAHNEILMIYFCEIYNAKYAPATKKVFSPERRECFEFEYNDGEVKEKRTGCVIS
jgi:hypothetical protein